MEDSHPEDNRTERRPTRFAWGLALGALGGGLLIVLIVATVTLFIYLDARQQFDAYSSGSSELTYVQSSEPWIEMSDGKRGRVSGYGDGGWGSGSDMEHGAIAEFNLTRLTRQDGVPARILVRILVTPETEITKQGQPWKLKGANREWSPAEMLFFDGAAGDSTYDFLDSGELTVEFRREGDALIAESIDSSGSGRPDDEFLGY